MCDQLRTPRSFESSRLDERTMLQAGCGASALGHPVRGETRYTLSRASGVPEAPAGAGYVPRRVRKRAQLIAERNEIPWLMLCFATALRIILGTRQ